MTNLYNDTFYLPAQEYLRTSTRFKKHFDKILSDEADTPFLTFLSGAAGTGKSCTLHHELLIPLESQSVKYFLICFKPNENLNNHFFLKNIVEQLISYHQDRDVSSTLLDDLKHLHTDISNRHNNPFSHNDHHIRLADILWDISGEEKTVLIFEDIHLSKRSFSDFLSQISAHTKTGNLHIVCTTRLLRSDHNLCSIGSQKWFHLEKLSQPNFKKYLSLLNKRYQTNMISNDQLMALSDGNPFYMKELCILDLQRKITGISTSNRKQGGNLNPLDGKTSIISMRYSYLNDRQKEILSILSLLGVSVHLQELNSVLKELDIGDLENDLSALELNGFVTVEQDNVNFRHHLIYEGIKNSILPNEKKSLSAKIFFFLKKSKHIKNYERLADYSYEAGFFGYSCFYFKNIATSMYQNSFYDIAHDYYDRYVETLKFCSSQKNILNRTIEALIPLHASCLILGKNSQAEIIASYLSNVSQEVSIEQKYKIYSTLTTSYWTIGERIKASSYAERNVEIADVLDIQDNKISAYSRHGTLSMEIGDFKKALNLHQEAVNLIAPDEHHKKFGMFVEAYSCSTSIQSFCHFEMGNIALSHQLSLSGYNYFSKTNDPFTKLFISVHCGYAMIMMGHFEEALSYLEKGIATREQTKAALLIPEALALAGLCNLHLGNISESNEYFDSAMDIRSQNFHGSKKGMTDLVYAESLLINFDTDTFAKTIDDILDDAKRMQQFPYVAWLYFYKAVYHAFYNRSIQGFIGAYAKASAIAQNLEMGTLLDNLQSLASLEESGLLALRDKKAHAPGFFDKAEFFYKKTLNVKPLSFHIEHRTRS